jgi:hypothetical protein
MTLQGVLAPSTVAPVFYFASPYTLCASAHPAKDFLLSQHGEISRAKMVEAWEVSEILPF